MADPKINPSVADLVTKLHTNIDSIHATLSSLTSTSSTHHAELERLSLERETKIAELRASHEDALKELALQRQKEEQLLLEQRKKEQEELEDVRQREYEELMARRKMEDEEREKIRMEKEAERLKAVQDEDMRREAERDEVERSLQEKVERELELLEDEMERKVEEGRQALRELDERRKAINAEIDAALNTPTVIPPILFRSRAKTLKSLTNGTSSPVPEPVTLDLKAISEAEVTREENRTENVETPPSDVLSVVNGSRDIQTEEEVMPAPTSRSILPPTPEDTIINKSDLVETTNIEYPAFEAEYPGEKGVDDEVTSEVHAKFVESQDMGSSNDGLSQAEHIKDVIHDEVELAADSELPVATPDSIEASISDVVGTEEPLNQHTTAVEECEDVDTQNNLKAATQPVDSKALDNEPENNQLESSSISLEDAADKAEEEVIPAASEVAKPIPEAAEPGSVRFTDETEEAPIPELTKDFKMPPAKVDENGIEEPQDVSTQPEDLSTESIIGNNSSELESRPLEPLSVMPDEAKHDESVTAEETSRPEDARGQSLLETAHAKYEHSIVESEVLETQLEASPKHDPPVLEDSNVDKDQDLPSTVETTEEKAILHIQTPDPSKDEEVQENDLSGNIQNFLEEPEVQSGETILPKSEDELLDRADVLGDKGSSLVDDLSIEIDELKEPNTTAEKEIDSAEDEKATNSYAEIVGEPSVNPEAIPSVDAEVIVSGSQDIPALASGDDHTVSHPKHEEDVLLADEALFRESHEPTVEHEPQVLDLSGEIEALDAIETASQVSTRDELKVPTDNLGADANEDNSRHTELDETVTEARAEDEPRAPSRSEGLEELGIVDETKIPLEDLDVDEKDLLHHVSLERSLPTGIEDTHFSDDETEKPTSNTSSNSKEGMLDAVETSSKDEHLLTMSQVSSAEVEEIDTQDEFIVESESILDDVTSKVVEDGMDIDHYHEDRDDTKNTSTDDEYASAFSEEASKEHLVGAAVLEIASKEPVSGADEDTLILSKDTSTDDEHISVFSEEASKEHLIGAAVVEMASKEPVSGADEDTLILSKDTSTDDESTSVFSEEEPKEHLIGAAVVEMASKEPISRADSNTPILSKAPSVSNDDEDEASVLRIPVDKHTHDISVSVKEIASPENSDDEETEDSNLPTKVSDAEEHLIVNSSSLCADQQQSILGEKGVELDLISDVEDGTHDLEAPLDDSTHFVKEEAESEEQPKEGLELPLHAPVEESSPSLASSIESSSVKNDELDDVQPHEDAKAEEPQSVQAIEVDLESISHMQSMDSEKSLTGIEDAAKSIETDTESLVAQTVVDDVPQASSTSIPDSTDDETALEPTHISTSSDNKIAESHTQAESESSAVVFERGPNSDETKIESSEGTVTPTMDHTTDVHGESEKIESAEQNSDNKDLASLDADYVEAEEISLGGLDSTTADGKLQDAANSPANLIVVHEDAETEGVSLSTADLEEEITSHGTPGEKEISTGEISAVDEVQTDNVQKTDKESIDVFKFLVPDDDQTPEVEAAYDTMDEGSLKDGVPLNGSTGPHDHDLDVGVQRDLTTEMRQVVAEEIHINRFAESPVTVLNTDDLFDDDTDSDISEAPRDDSDADGEEGENGDMEDEEETYDSDESESEEDSDELAPAAISSKVERSFPHVIQNMPSYEFGKPKMVDPFSETSHDQVDFSSSHRSSGLFASLVDTIKSDLPVVKQMVSNGESRSQQQDEYLSRSETNMRDAPKTDIPNAFQQTDTEEDAPFHDTFSDHQSNNLHVRSHTADTVPSFESYAHSDGDSTASETPSSPFEEAPREEPRIATSAPMHENTFDDHQQMKAEASPLRAEFDPLGSNTYPKFITPKQSQANLRSPVKSPRSPRNDRFVSQSIVSPKGPRSPRGTPSPTSRRFSQSSTNGSSRPIEARPYDTPPSRTLSMREKRLSQDSLQSPSMKRSMTDQKPSGTRTPVSSPSIPPSSFFQKTRSLFENTSAQASQAMPAVTRPLSGYFNGRGSPSPSPSPKLQKKGSMASLRSRPSSLYQTELPLDEEGELIIRSLDGDGKPPSPVFTIPSSVRPDSVSSQRKSSHGSIVSKVENDLNVFTPSKDIRPRSSNPFTNLGLSKLVGSEKGLEDSMYNPHRRVDREKVPLLAEDRDGEGEGEDGGASVGVRVS